MKKKYLYHLVAFTLGLTLSAIYFTLSQEEGIPSSLINSGGRIPSEPEESSSLPLLDEVHYTDSWSLLQVAYTTLSALEKEDFTTLSTLIHPEQGVRFTPYSYVDKDMDLIFTASQVKNALEDNTTYCWGVYDGSGFSMNLTMEEYFQQFVVPVKYSIAPHVAIDTVLITGNALENIVEAYPEERFVDFSFRSIDPEFGGLDWTSLKLVFQLDEDGWYLVAVVHSQWTI